MLYFINFIQTNLISDVINHNSCLGAPVVHWGQGVVPLLSSRVPYFELDRRVRQANRLRQEGRCVWRERVRKKLMRENCI